MATRTTQVQHNVEELATLRPGSTLVIEFQPDPGGIQVFFDLDRVIIPEDYGNALVVGRRTTAGAAAGGTLAGTRRARPTALPRRKLPGRLNTRNIRDPQDPGDIMWDPPETLPTTYPVEVQVGPAGGPYKTEPGPVPSRSLTFTGPVPPPAGGGGGVGLGVDTAPPLGVGGGPPNRPATWECHITNIDPEKTYQVRVLIGFMVRRVVEVTKIPRDRLTVVFEGALRWLTPVISVRFGEVTVGLSPDAAELLNRPPLPPVSTDQADITDIDFTLEPSNFEVMSARRMLLETFTDLANEIRGPLPPGPFNHPIEPPADFADRLTDAALHSISADLVALATDMLPIPDVPTVKAAAKTAITGLFARLNIPTKIPHYNPVLADDIALKVTITITSIRAAAKAFVGTAEVFVDRISAQCYVVMRTNTRHEPHPGVAYEGELTPVQHLDLMTRFMFRIGDIDVDLEGDGFFQDLAAEAVEAVANLFDDEVARAVENVVNDTARDFLSNPGVLSELAEKVITDTADRDDLLHDVRLDPSFVIFEHFDPLAGEDFTDQFLPPRRRRALGPPIDGPMPADADQRLQAINHIVVVTMENRSFDTMVGYLSHQDLKVQPDGPRTDIDGLTGNERIPPGGNIVGNPVTPLPASPQEFHPDPNHNYDGVQIQLGPTGAMDGFMVAQRARILESTEINQEGPFNDEANIVHFQPAARVPIYNYLASEFCILDRYFCAFPGGTQPNRVCMLTGATPVLRNSEFTPDLGYLGMPTLFEQLDENTTTWRYYEGDVGFLRVFDKYRLDFNHLRPLEPFLNETGPLPNVTFIDPNFKEMPSAEPPSDDHAPTPVCRGQALLARILDRLAAQPAADRRSTLLIVTYDEHGGFYDHVAPPGTAVFDARNPTVDRELPLVHPQALTYGVRVPTFLASPYIDRGVSSRNIYDHTSITRTILQRFAPDKVQYMPARVRKSRHFGELLLSTPRTNIRNPPTPRQAGCRTRQLAASTPASPVFYDRIVLAADDERVSLQRLGTHGVR